LIAKGVTVVRRSEEDDAFLLDRLDRFADDTRLIERFSEIEDVVADDATPCVGERKDAVGEILLADKGGVEAEIGARGNVVHDLHHRAPLIRAGGVVGVREVLQHLHLRGRRQRAVGFVRRRPAQIVEAVGQDADREACASDAEI
jgi:hypothetical protein